VNGPGPQWSYADRVHPSRVPTHPHAAVVAALLVPTAVMGSQAGRPGSGVRCLPAGGWIADAGQRLALWHADAGCGSGTWALTASGLAALLGSALLIVVLAAQGSHRTAVRLIAAVSRPALPPPTDTRVRGPHRAVVSVRSGRYPSERWVVRGPPAA